MESSSVSANPPALLDKIKTMNTMNELPSTRPSLLDRLSDSIPCQQTVKMMNMPEKPDSTTTCYRGTKRKAQAISVIVLIPGITEDPISSREFLS
jgi:hypothetical protein